MELSKSLKKVLLISASILMFASVGDASSQALVPSSNTIARASRVSKSHHHKHHKSHKHHSRKSHKHHHSHAYKHHRTHRHHKHHHHHHKHFSKKHQQAYDDLGKRLRRKILKYHKRYVHGGTYKVTGSGYYVKGFRDASQEGKPINPTPTHEPGIYPSDIKHDHGSKNNYELGWIDGYINGNYNDRMRPSHDTKFKLYNDAMKTYIKMCDRVAQPVYRHSLVVYASDVM